MRVLNFNYDSSTLIGVKNQDEQRNYYKNFHSYSGTVNIELDNALSDFGPFWPQTLDFRPPWKCQLQNLNSKENSKKCLKERFSGIWQFPISLFPRLIDYNVNSKTNNNLFFDSETNLPIKVTHTFYLFL